MTIATNAKPITPCWRVKCENSPPGINEIVTVCAEAETADKAKYKAFKVWQEAFPTTYSGDFMHFLKYVILSVGRVS